MHVRVNHVATMGSALTSRKVPVVNVTSLTLETVVRFVRCLTDIHMLYLLLFQSFLLNMTTYRIFSYVYLPSQQGQTKEKIEMENCL